MAQRSESFQTLVSVWLREMAVEVGDGKLLSFPSHPYSSNWECVWNADLWFSTARLVVAKSQSTFYFKTHKSPHTSGLPGTVSASPKLPPLEFSDHWAYEPADMGWPWVVLVFSEWHVGSTQEISGSRIKHIIA